MPPMLKEGHERTLWDRCLQTGPSPEATESLRDSEMSLWADFVAKFLFRCSPKFFWGADAIFE
jgi:hypothetical protein